MSVAYLRPERSQVPVSPTKIWGPTCTWDLAGCRYLFFPRPKYEAQSVSKTWPNAFPNQNIRPVMYLQPGRSLVSVYPPKIWGATCTCNRYLFIQTKYQARHVSVTWPVADTCLPTQNKERDVYLQPVSVYPTKIWCVTYICNLTRLMRYGWWDLVDKTWLIRPGTCFIRGAVDVYLKSGWSQVSVSPTRIWGATCTRDLDIYLKGQCRIWDQHWGIKLHIFFIPPST